MSMPVIEHQSTMLYKKDTSSRIRQWDARVEENEGHVTVITNTGVKGGTIKAHSSLAKKTPTMGPLASGIARVTNAETKKLSDGYFPTIQEAKDYNPNRAMLLHRWDKYSAKMVYPCFIQPKLDGVCGMYVDDATDPHFKSRENNRFPKLDDYAKRISAFLTAVNGSKRSQMDSHGELYVHGRKVSEIVEAIKGDNQKVLDELMFFTFDYMEGDAKNKGYKKRLQEGSKFYNWGNPASPVEPIRTLIAQNAEQVDEHHDIFVKLGYEGVVASAIGGDGYLFDRRTYSKLKKKQLFTEEFDIVDIVHDDYEGKEMIKFHCKTGDGVVFAVVPEWSHEKRAEAYKEHVSGDTVFIGKPATVEYRSMTKYNTPFHSVLIAVRDYE
jgi:hypothetical protein